ncbi:hypothetical protein GCM10011386_05230 [Parapedobacter defluvii]|uniref:Uncharacterized protein n=1 Tax=Parapedobacter defluvii TaxID=2045106 RepID=A0ABQ1L3N6_9SPHI|nr:hypothetical protein GCM10011386_05230 [Parapedobacter defluvii]
MFFENYTKRVGRSLLNLTTFTIVFEKHYFLTIKGNKFTFIYEK